MTRANVLILVHGMVPDKAPSSPFAQYEAFWQQLCLYKRDLSQQIKGRIGVQWGHEMPTLSPDELKVAGEWRYTGPRSGADIRQDEKLTRAQIGLGTRVNYDAVRTDPSRNNILMSGFFNHDYGIPIIREKLFVGIRESIILRGFGDVLYYCSPEGETAIRRVVYDQILTQLDTFSGADEVRIHIFGHSLGVTLTHDFLYGLFAEGHEPGFVQEKQGDAEAVRLFRKWRKKAQEGGLKLGGLVSAASQLPLFVMRKPAMVDVLFNDGYFQPKDIGVANTNQIQWKIFYDVDDMLGFPTRRMYRPDDAILEVQVDSGDDPGTAHTDYWNSTTVIRETAELFSQHCQ
jgi:hypothetical protein